MGLNWGLRRVKVWELKRESIYTYMDRYRDKMKMMLVLCLLLAFRIQIS